MAFIRVSGTPNVQMLPSPASTAQTVNALATIASGALALAASTTSLIAGIFMEQRASTDADYATARPTAVDMLDNKSVLQCDTVVGTLTSAMVGQFLKLSSTTGINADAATATDTPAAGLVLLCVGFISATSGLFVVNGLKSERSAS